MKAAMKQKSLVMLGQMNLLMIEYQKQDWIFYSKNAKSFYINNLIYSNKQWYIASLLTDGLDSRYKYQFGLVGDPNVKSV